MKRLDDDIARHIAAHGVTRCPTAFAAPTTASVSPADLDAHRARGPDPLGDAWRRRNGRCGGWAGFWAKKRAGKAQAKPMRRRLVGTALLALKSATRTLVHDVGGLAAAEAACRLQHSSLHRHYSAEHPDAMPVDVVAQLECAAGRAPVTAALARLSGHALVPMHVDEPGQPELLRRLGGLMRRVGATCATGAEAMEDGVLSLAERAVLSRELHEVVSIASGLMAWLSAGPEQDGEEGR